MTYLIISSAFILSQAGFIISTVKKRNDLADSFWGLYFIAITITSLYLNKSHTFFNILLSAVVIVWASRLSIHIHKRNSSKKEDVRYAKWRKEWGKLVHIRSYIQIYTLQPILAIIISLPVIYALKETHNQQGIIQLIGLGVSIIAIIIESTADNQLLQFIKNKRNKGLIMKSGLWRYSRHPNYFAEILFWWGIYLSSQSTQTNNYLIISPILITFLILKISGIPMLEKHMSQKPGYKKYIQTTNKIIPWFPKN